MSDEIKQASWVRGDILAETQPDPMPKPVVEVKKTKKDKE